MGAALRRKLAWPALLAGILAGIFFLVHHVLGEAALPRADLVIANGPDPRSLDPAVTSAIADGRVLTSLFEGLLGTDPETLALVPALAQELPRVSRDGLTWTFQIRSGLKWSDGVLLDSFGLRWSFLRFLDPATAAGPFTEFLSGVVGARAYNSSGTAGDREAVGIESENDRTLIFRLLRPQPQFPSLVSLFPLFPVPRHVVEAHGARWVKPGNFVSNGPFRLVDWRLRDRIRVERNPYYRAASEVRLETIDFLAVESPATALNLYVSGVADVITDVPPAAVPALLRRYGPAATGEFEPGLRLGTFLFKINARKPPFTNRKIREALSAAVDRQAIVDSVTRAGELAARSFVPPGTRCGDVVYEPPLLCVHDPKAARRLLEEGLAEERLAISSFPVFEVLYSTSEATDQPIAELLQEAWAGLGLRCRLVNLDGKSIRTVVRKGDFTVARSSWIGDYNDPATFLDLFVSNAVWGNTGWSSRNYDSIIQESAPTAKDSAERSALFHEAEATLLRSGTLIPIYHYVSRSMAKPWVKGWYRNILDWHPLQRVFTEGRPR